LLLQFEVSSKSNFVGDVNLSSESGTVSKGIGNGHLLSSGVELDSREKEMDSSWRDLLNSTMFEEYLKYFKSLNDRQREAACTDISTPLMIVAGPRSRKVFLYFRVFLVHCMLTFSFPFVFFIFILELIFIFNLYQTSTMVRRVLMMLNEVMQNNCS